MPSSITGKPQGYRRRADGLMIYVSPSGSDVTGDGSSAAPYATISKAQDTIVQQYYIDPTSQVTIVLKAGTHTGTGIAPRQGTGWSTQQWRVVGETVHTRWITSVQGSPSGSAGAWSVIVNVNSTTGLSVGDYAIVTSIEDGTGTNEHTLGGCWEITNVDSGNSRVTLAVKSNHSTAPSGTIRGTMIVPKAIISTSGNGIFSNRCQGPSVIDGLILVGPGNAGRGVTVGAGGNVWCNRVGIVQFTDGFLSQYSGSYLQCTNCAVGGLVNGVGFYAYNGGRLEMNACSAGGCSVGARGSLNASLSAITGDRYGGFGYNQTVVPNNFSGNINSGLWCTYRSTYVGVVYCQGNGAAGATISYHSILNGPGSKFTSNTLSGVVASGNGALLLGGGVLVSSSNGSAGVLLDANSSMNLGISTTTITNNTGIGLVAQLNSGCLGNSGTITIQSNGGGVQASLGSSIRHESGTTVSSNTSYGVQATTGSHVRFASASISSNGGDNVSVTSGSDAYLDGATTNSSSGGSGVNAQHRSGVQAQTITSSSNSQYAIRAQSQSYIRVVNANGSGNGSGQSATSTGTGTLQGHNIAFNTKGGNTGEGNLSYIDT